MIFVDTSAWFAYADRETDQHHIARGLFANHHDRLVTTDYVLAELLTLLRARRRDGVALSLGQRLLSGADAQLIWVTPADVARAWEFFQFRDKEWSFVDCVSFAVIERLGISTAFSYDNHFRQFGKLIVLP